MTSKGREVIARQRETHPWVCDGEALDSFGDSLRLGAIRLQKFEPRRRRREEFNDLDARAIARGRRLHRALVAAIDDDRPAVGVVGAARGDGEPRYRADRRQRLAAKAERVDGQEIAARQFRGGVTLHRELQVVARHAGAVIGDADEAPPARLDDHLDGARSCIQRVLDQLLDGRGRPLDHLAGGDTVDENGIEPANRHVSLS